MDLSDEVCLKIKSAIKARLKELGIIWDRELPDYVMVLIKNRKTKEQMENDLNIFLGPHTAGFTEWLYDVCQKLEEACAVTSKGIKKKEEEKKPKEKRLSVDDQQEDWEEGLSNDSEDENYSSSYSQSAIGRSPLLRDENGFRDNSEGGEKKTQSTQQNSLREEQRKPRERIHINWSDDKQNYRRRERSRSQQNRPRRSRSKSRHRSRSTSRLKDDGSRRKERGGSKYRERSGSRERRVRDAREFIRSRNSQERSRDGFGRRKGEKERSIKSQTKHKNDAKLPSLVKVTPRPVRPLSMQPPPNLILKAVADAHKSIAITSLPQPEDKLGHDDTPITKPIRKKQPVFRKKLRPGFEANLSVTLLNDRVPSNKPETPPEPDYGFFESMEENRLSHQRVPEVPRFTISLQSDDDSIIGSDYEENEENGVAYEPPPVENALQPEPEPMDITGVELVEEKETIEPPAYRFDRSRLGPRVMPVVPDAETVLECLAPNSNITKTIMNENAFSDGSETRSDENDKLIKCKFWPSCEAGDTCRFYHPKTICRSRNCKFGQKCLFIHPPCKFGEKCLNVACPYTHNLTSSSGSAPPVTGKSWTKVPLAPSNGQICMFFPNCTKPFCPYQHYGATGSGIPCKYGSMCTKLSCEFDHPQSSKNPYKWVAPNPE